MIGKVTLKIDTRPHCPNGWNSSNRAPSCNYTGGHYCCRLEDHSGRCVCVCGATSTLDPKRGVESEQA